MQCTKHLVCANPCYFCEYDARPKTRYYKCEDCGEMFNDADGGERHCKKEISAYIKEPDRNSFVFFREAEC